MVRRRRVTETGPVERVDAPPPWAWTAVALVVLAAAMVLVAVGAVNSWERTATRPAVPQILVPGETARSAETAQRDLERRGFVVDLQPEPNILVPPGTIVGQAPVGGSKLEQGSRVVLRVSAGPPGVAVPDVRGVQVPEAVRSLAVVGLTAESVPTFSDSVRPGEVISTSPRRGREVLPGSRVRLAVSNGPRPRVVPPMVGQPAPNAFAALARAGLAAGRVRERVVTGTPAGVVVSTDPPAGTARPPKFPVAVVLSAPPRTVTVPDFVGLSRDGAVTVARAGSVRVVGKDEFVGPGSPEGGTVLGQSLPPGSEVAPGTLVELVVGVDPTAPPG